MSEVLNMQESSTWADLVGGAKRPSPRDPSPATISEAAPETPVTPAATLASDDDAEYRAFVTDRTLKGDSMFVTLTFRAPQSGVWEGYMMPLLHLKSVYFIGEDNVVLEFADATFQIEGRHMKQLVTHLRSKNLETIQEFSAHDWKEPPRDQPKVVKITYIDARQNMEMPGFAGRAR